MWKVIRDEDAETATAQQTWELAARTCVAGSGTLSEVSNNNHLPLPRPPPAGLPAPGRKPPLETDCPDACLRRGMEGGLPMPRKYPHSARSQVTSKSNEENIFPMMIAAFEPLGYDACFLSKRSTCKADSQEWTVGFGGRQRME